jgi:hypothetical protein
LAAYPPHGHDVELKCARRKPFKWTAKADSVLEKNARARQVLVQLAAVLIE